MPRIGQRLDHSIIAGTVDASAGTMVCSDGAATITDNGDGDFTITFNHDFLTAPNVSATSIAGAEAAPSTCTIAAVTTTSVQIQTITNTAGTGALADVDFSFIVIGRRDM